MKMMVAFKSMLFILLLGISCDVESKTTGQIIDGKFEEIQENADAINKLKDRVQATDKNFSAAVTRVKQNKISLNGKLDSLKNKVTAVGASVHRMNQTLGEKILDFRKDIDAIEKESKKSGKNLETYNQSVTVQIRKLQKKMISYRHSDILGLQSKVAELKAVMKSSNLDFCYPCKAMLGNRCDCRGLTPQTDCLSFYQNGTRFDGLYTLTGNIQVYCDQTTQGGGWTVIQRRQNGLQSFKKTWRQYKQGFGDLDKNFWLGNENIYQLTRKDKMTQYSTLMVNLKLYGTNKYVYAKYDSFYLEPESMKYKLWVSGYSGTAKDKLGYHSGSKFYTQDADNWFYCANRYLGGWWFKKPCYASYLNGYYTTTYLRHGVKNNYEEIHWGKKEPQPVYTEMKIRRNVH